MNIVSEFTADQIAYWSARHLEAQPSVMACPPGMPDCEPAAVILTRDEYGARVVRVGWKPNEIELAHLAQGGTLWLSQWGGLAPHMLEVQAPAREVPT